MLINGNALQIPLRSGSVHMVVTSPPYYSLRDYGTAKWVGGDPGCDHKITHYNDNLKPNVDRPFRGDRSRCLKCGALRVDQQLGLEQTPEEYVANMVAVFREVWRVLRDDGTLWLNIGDSYAGSNALTTNEKALKGKQGTNHGTHGNIPPRDYGDTLKPKDLIGIPWRLAFALQADGWYLRSDIIWAKPNPMPESVTDRPTKSHEYVFLLSKSARYFYDADAVREENSDNSHYGGTYRSDYKYANDIDGRRGNGNIGKSGMTIEPNPAGRNRRTVWTIATAPYSGAHFATYPPGLVEPCIKAGTSERGVCPICGKPWERMVEREKVYEGGERSYKNKGKHADFGNGTGRNDAEFLALTRGTSTHVTTLGFRPACDCPEHDPIPATVFDPFAGSGTTPLVARQLGRRAVGLDLSYDYLHEQARERLGLAALDAWKNGKQAAETSLLDLPLFGDNHA